MQLKTTKGTLSAKEKEIDTLRTELQQARKKSCGDPSVWGRVESVWESLEPDEERRGPHRPRALVCAHRGASEATESRRGSRLQNDWLLKCIWGVTPQLRHAEKRRKESLKVLQTSLEELERDVERQKQQHRCAHEPHRIGMETGAQ